MSDQKTDAPVSLSDEDIGNAAGGFPGEMLDQGGDQQFPGEMLDGGPEPSNPLARFGKPKGVSIDLEQVGPKVSLVQKSIFKR